MVKIEDNSFFFTVLKGTLDGYPRIIVTKWQEMGNEQMHDKDGREIFTEFFYIYIYILHFEAGKYITYSEYNKKEHINLQSRIIYI